MGILTDEVGVCPTHHCDLVCPRCQQVARGKRSSSRKAQAARANGAKGGRPLLPYWVAVVERTLGATIWRSAKAYGSRLLAEQAGSAWLRAHPDIPLRDVKYSIVIVNRVSGEVTVWEV